MKNIILSIMLFIPSLVLAVTDLEVPLEMNAFQIEFSDLSKTGIIRVSECHRCKDKIYKFDETIEIKREGNVITIEELLNEHLKVKYPTIFLKINVRIEY
jgi:hypothetical protein